MWICGCLCAEVFTVECLCPYLGGFRWTADSEAYPGFTDFHAADFGRIFDLTFALVVDQARWIGWLGGGQEW